MQKRIIGLFAALIVFQLGLVSAVCSPDVTLVSQDPYPATPGDYVRLVFQVSDLTSSDCGYIEAELLEDYPLLYDPGAQRIKSVSSGFYERDFGSFVTVPYRVRVDTAALDGDNPIEVALRYGPSKTELLYEFDLYVEDSRADFEVYINDYDYTTRELTLEVLNIADTDIEALTVEIPRQESIDVRGSNVDVVGDLDSQEFTTADFIAVPQDGQIQVKLLYTDQAGTRRELIKTLTYDSTYFAARADEQESSSGLYIAVVVVLLVGLGWYFFRRRKKKKHAQHHKSGKASF